MPDDDDVLRQLTVSRLSDKMGFLLWRCSGMPTLLEVGAGSLLCRVFHFFHGRLLLQVVGITIRIFFVLLTSLL
ncbi:hypothetical protein F4679DRAFT_564790 [Xylaria curta]|nr:hypothetical protein F4679DRAFT_564790 [Xylaria curta]